MDTVTESKKVATQVRENFNKEVDELLRNKDMDDIINSHKMRQNYESNERFMWHTTTETTKSSIEQIFGVTDYREATVNGKKIFANLDSNAMDDASIVIDSSGKNTTDVVNAAKRLAEDSNCKMKVNNARDFNHLMNAVKETIGDIKVTDHQKILGEINTMYDSASNALLNDTKIQLSSINSAAVHGYKHAKEFGPNTTIEEYLTTERDNLIKPENARGVWVYSQDGKWKCTNYRSTEDGRYRFGVVRTNIQTNQSYITTMHVRSEAGITTASTNAAVVTNSNPPNPPTVPTTNVATQSSANPSNANTNTISCPSSMHCSLSAFTSNMFWLTPFFNAANKYSMYP